MSKLDHAKWLVRRYAKGLRSGELPRGAAYKIISRYTPLVVVDRGYGTYLVPTGDLTGLRTFMMGHYELDVMRSAVELLTEWVGRDPMRDQVLIEVGANIGTTTVPALRDFGATRVVAIEPDVENLRILRSNLVLNDLLDRVTIVHAAASDEEGEVELELSPASVGDHRVRRQTAEPPQMGEQHRATVTVPARRLDTIVAESVGDLTEVGLVWMDVQGHEAHVLGGAGRLIDAGIPVMTEYWPYGLQRSGGLALMHELLRDRFRTVVDVRAGTRGRAIPKDEIEGLARAYPTFDTYTDLLLLP